MIRGLNKITESAGLGYLMSSYTSHIDATLAEQEAKEIAANLMQSGLVVFAPIAYGPGIEKNITGFDGSDEKYIKSHEFWMPICERFFERCDYGIIATTSGWHKSVGIAIELFSLTMAGVPIWVFDINENRILTLDEAADKFEDEVEELIQRASELRIKHLTAETATYTEALAMTFEYLGMKKKNV